MIFFKLNLIILTIAVTEQLVSTGQKQSFQVIWNAPSQICHSKYNISLDLDEFKIKHNLNQSFFGNTILLLYEDKLGLYPYIDRKGLLVNGGIPQRTNITAHLEKLEYDMAERFPENYSGLAVIDWESWRPRYDLNWSSRRLYQTESLNYAKEMQPNATDDQIEKFAKKSFNTAAKHLMLITLQTIQTSFPNAKIGYYGFPICYYKLSVLTCSKTSHKNNRKLSWLYRASSAVYPSIYMKPHDSALSDVDRATYIRNRIRDTTRIMRKLKLEHKCVYAYSKFAYDTYTDPPLYYETQAADLGVDGVIIWSSSKSFNSVQKCNLTKFHLEDGLGPAASDAITKAARCSTSQCNDHGRCYSPLLEWNGRKIPFRYYRCRCSSPYKGSHCKLSSISSGFW